MQMSMSNILTIRLGLVTQTVLALFDVFFFQIIHNDCLVCVDGNGILGWPS